jgi:hypothetical protein
MTGGALRQPARIGQCRLTRFRTPRPLCSATSWPTTRRCTGPFSISERHRSANSACICVPTTCSPKQVGQAARLRRRPSSRPRAARRLGQFAVATGHSSSRDDRRLLEAVEAGLQAFVEALAGRAELQSVALDDIRARLISLGQLMRESPPDVDPSRTSGSRACVRRLVEQRGGLHGKSRAYHRAAACRGRCRDEFQAAHTEAVRRTWAPSELGTVGNRGG